MKLPRSWRIWGLWKSCSVDQDICLHRDRPYARTRTKLTAVEKRLRNATHREKRTWQYLRTGTLLHARVQYSVTFMVQYFKILKLISGLAITIAIIGGLAISYCNKILQLIAKAINCTEPLLIEDNHIFYCACVLEGPKNIVPLPIMILASATAGVSCNRLALQLIAIPQLSIRDCNVVMQLQSKLEVD